MALTIDEEHLLVSLLESEDLDELAKGCTASLSMFVRESWAALEGELSLEWNWHHELACSVTQAAFEDWESAFRLEPWQRKPFRLRNIIFNLPPGTLKSRILAVCLNAWAWLRVPEWSAICSSANPRVAQRDAVYTLDMIASDWYQKTFRPKWKVRQDRSARSNFGNSDGGFRVSRGAGAKVIGDRAWWLINDDANDPKDVEAEADRDNVNMRWDALYNRVNDERIGVRLNIQQRTHELDLTGHILSKGGLWSPANPSGWLHISVPAQYDPQRPLRTPFGSDPRALPGESVHPSRMSAEFIQSEAERLGTYRFSGQYNQSPAPAAGGIFQRTAWNFYKAGPPFRPSGCTDRPAVEAPGAFDALVISIDCSFKDHDDSDYVGMLVVGSRGGRRYVLENATARRGATETAKAAKELRLRYPSAKIIVEEAANGFAVIETLKRDVGNVQGVSAAGGKLPRAWSCQGSIESGDVHLPEGAPWLDSFIDELAKFPKVQHDDQVDALTHALAHMAGTSAANRLAAWAGK